MSGLIREVIWPVLIDDINQFTSGKFKSKFLDSQYNNYQFILEDLIPYYFKKIQEIRFFLLKSFTDKNIDYIMYDKHACSKNTTLLMLLNTSNNHINEVNLQYINQLINKYLYKCR